MRERMELLRINLSRRGKRALRTGHQEPSLTDKERARLEKAGRRLAVRELEKMGFSVEDMPPDNPGFDLRAKTDGQELRVEVKAHTGRATVVDVTQRQYKEYLGQQGYRWELWNVEHVAENDAEQIAITRYGDIPDDALDARTFRVDLKKCLSPACRCQALDEPTKCLLSNNVATVL